VGPAEPVSGPAFSIDRAVIDRHPDLLVGGFRASGLRAAAEACGDPAPVFAAARQALSEAGVTLHNLVEQPQIAAWRSAIGACGLRPSRYRSSAEQLARRVLKDGAVHTPLPLVTLYCAVSAHHLAPLGAYDLSRLPELSIVLRECDPATDAFLPLGGNPEDMPLQPEVVVYASGDRVLCWAYNVRDSRETGLTDETDEGLFLGEAVERSQHEPLRNALEDLRARLQRLGASVEAIATFDRTRLHGAM